MSMTNHLDSSGSFHGQGQESINSPPCSLYILTSCFSSKFVSCIGQYTLIVNTLAFVYTLSTLQATLERHSLLPWPLHYKLASHLYLQALSTNLSWMSVLGTTP